VIDRAWRLALFAAYRILRAWWFVRRPAVDGAYVALWCDDSLLLIRNSYKRGETVPSGSIHRGESPRDAARRELEEEVGVRATADSLRAVAAFTVAYHHKRDRAHFFELRLEDEPEIRIDRREVVWASFRPADELARRPLVPHVRAYLEHTDSG
jgi:8-oxo-dGTP diphosphatase